MSIVSLYFFFPPSLLNLFQSGYQPPHSTVAALVNLLKNFQDAHFCDPFLVLILSDVLAIFDGVEGLLTPEKTLYTWLWITFFLVSSLSC